MKNFQLFKLCSIFFLFFSFLFLFKKQVWSEADPVNQVKDMDLRASIQWALDHSPILKIKINEHSIKKKEKKIARSKLFPSLDFSSNQGLSESSHFPDSNSWKSRASVSLSLPLYSNHENRTHLKIAKVKEKISLIELEKKRNQLLLDIVTEFYEVSKQILDLKISEKQYQLIEAQYKKILKEYRSGTKLRKDFLRFKGQLRLSELRMVQQENKYLIAVERLKRIIGAKESDRFSFKPILVQPKLKILPSLFPEDMENHYDYRISKLNQNLQRLAVRLSYRKYIPELSLGTSLSYSHGQYWFQSSSQDSSLGWEALFGIKYNFWDGGQRRRAYEIEKVRLDTAQRRLDQKVLELREKMSTLIFNSKMLRKEINLTRELLSIEKQSFENIQKEYRLGRSTYLDFITALKDFLGASLNYQSTYFNYLKFIANIKFYKGTIYEELTNTKY